MTFAPRLVLPQLRLFYFYRLVEVTLACQRSNFPGARFGMSRGTGASAGRRDGACSSRLSQLATLLGLVACVIIVVRGYASTVLTMSFAASFLILESETHAASTSNIVFMQRLRQVDLPFRICFHYECHALASIQT